MMSKNSVGNIIKIAAVVVAVLGVAGSFVFGDTFSIIDSESLFLAEEKFNWGVALGGIFCTALSTVILYGFGEIISLLQDSVDTQKSILKNLPDIQNAEVEENGPAEINIPTADKSFSPVEQTPGQKVVPLQTNLQSEIQCPVCGQKQRSTMSKCVKCGAEFTDK